MNRVSNYFDKLEVATYELLAVGESTTRLCYTHSYFEAACEADEMVRGVLPMPIDGVEYLVVLSPQGKQCGPRFPTQRAVRPEIPEPPEPVDIAILIAVFLIVVATFVGMVWLGSQ